SNPLAQSIYWGEEYIQLYNDAMTTLYGEKHPTALGQSFYQTWPEVWKDSLKPLFELIKSTGQAFCVENQLYHILRVDFLEEAYFTFSYSPIRDETGAIRGLSNIATETTQQVISQRRLRMLRELATAGSEAKTLKSACLAAADTFNPYDIPFALCYQVNPQGNFAELVASKGLSVDSTAAPPTIVLSSNDSAWLLAEVFQSREPQLMTDVVDRFGVLPAGPWPESPHSALVLPVLSGNKEQVECLLVMGISPRLPFNSEYRSFLEIVAQQVESSIAKARNYEEDRKRAAALAELDRTKTTFLRNVSHEFRTPLSLILGPAEDALTDKTEPLAPHQQQRFEIIQRNGLRLLKLVNALLDFSRIESDRIQAIHEPTDLVPHTTALSSLFCAAIEEDKATPVLLSEVGRNNPFAPTYAHIPSGSNRLLLVDANADMREYLKGLLRDRWQVETAENGVIALDLIQKQLPDLVLTDVMMPKMDGFQLIKTLRADAITQSIPIILLSAQTGEKAIVDGLEAGADDYLIKPFSNRELIARLETQLQMSRLRQELSANHFKNEFLMTITHELQSPLAAILGWIRLLQTQSLEPEAIVRALAVIERNATVEATLIKNLLDVTSILSGKLRLQAQDIDLGALVQHVVTTFQEAAESKNIQLVSTISKQGVSHIFADGDCLKQVIANLLENAIKFTPEGGTVKIGLERLASGIQITVSDTGIGLSAKFLPYAFDRFTQAEVPSRHTPGGVGLGLAIARHLVELHHGTIKVVSEGEGQGATFTIQLPFTRPAQSDTHWRKQ
ncbi:MAG TPA: ATP-binding protein, partial [Stenomitos sp.]